MKSAEISTEINSDKVSLVAEYPSNRDFRAFISHSTPDFDHKEAVMAIHLNNSHLIHSRMTWSPDLLSRVATSLEEKSVSAGYKAMEQWGLINQAIEDELSSKYSAVSSAIKEELTSFIYGLESQMTNLAREMSQINLPTKLTSAYRHSYGQLIQSLREHVAKMGSYPLRENYSALVKKSLSNSFLTMQKSINSLTAMTQQIEATLVKYKENTKQFANSLTSSVYNGTYVNMVMQKLNQMKNFDVAPYTVYLEIPEEYSGLLDRAKDYGVSALKSLYQRPEFDVYRKDINAVYQKNCLDHQLLGCEAISYRQHQLHCQNL